MIIQESFSNYLKRPELNNSTLKNYLKSPLDGIYNASKEWGESGAVNKGTLAHAASLEGVAAYKKLLEQEFILSGFPINKSTGKPFGMGSDKFKNWYAEQDQSKSVIFPDDLKETEKIIQSLRGHKAAQSVLKRCDKREITITWRCQYTGENCKARIDACGKGLGVDLKTTRIEFEIGLLESEIYKRAYHMQFAFYSDGLHQNGIDTDEFYVIFAQNKAPYDVGCFEVNYTAIEQGRTDYIQAIANYHKAQQPQQANVGRFPKIGTIGIPYYAIQQDEEAFADEIEEVFK